MTAPHRSVLQTAIALCDDLTAGVAKCNARRSSHVERSDLRSECRWHSFCSFAGSTLVKGRAMENSSGSSASVESLSGLTCAKMPAVVAWLDNGVGPSVCRALHKHGVPIVALARSKNHFQCQTRYVQRVIEVPEGDSAFIAHLASMADLFPDGAVLCPTNDVLATLINLNQERLKSVYRIATPAPGSLQLLGDKSRVAQALRRSEIIFPETWKVSSAEEVTSLLQKCR